jgi:hypothetical protein
MTDASAAAERADAHVQTILKAIVVGARIPDAKSVPGGEGIGAMFGVSGALEPPYDPEALCLLFEHSNSLRQNVDAYATNIDGFGHRLDPAIDFDADDADRRVGECIYLERLAARDHEAIGVSDAVEPTQDEIKSRRLELVQLARAERARVTSFLEACSFEQAPIGAAPKVALVDSELLVCDVRRRTGHAVRATPSPGRRAASYLVSRRAPADAGESRRSLRPHSCLPGPHARTLCCG